MYRLGIIEESLDNKNILGMIKKFFYSQRIEKVPEDDVPIWHTNEYHIPDREIIKLLTILEKHIKPTWYIHAFNEEKLYVVLQDKWFEISQEKDSSWNDMIEYGVEVAEVERYFLENIPLHV